MVELITGQTLAVDRYGDAAAPPLVLLHGLTGSRRAYQHVVPHLLDTDTGARLHVVNVDQRGHGESTRADLDHYDALSYSTDVAALIEVLGSEPAVVVGHSLGGVVALALAVTRPDLVRALFLEDPPCFEGDQARRDTSPAAKLFSAFVAHVRERQARDAPERDYQALVDPDTPIEDIQGRSRELRLWDPTTMQAAVAGVFWRGFDPLAAISCPVTLLRSDPLVATVFTPEDAEQFALANPHARIVEVSGARHVIRARATLPAYLGHLDAFLRRL
jgi:pimeloyl-ACP methyl ester carboxylesterase